MGGDVCCSAILSCGSRELFGYSSRLRGRGGRTAFTSPRASAQTEPHPRAASAPIRVRWGLALGLARTPNHEGTGAPVPRGSSHMDGDAGSQGTGCSPDAGLAPPSPRLQQGCRSVTPCHSVGQGQAAGAVKPWEPTERASGFTWGGHVGAWLKSLEDRLFRGPKCTSQMKALQGHLSRSEEPWVWDPRWGGRAWIGGGGGARSSSEGALPAGWSAGTLSRLCFQGLGTLEPQLSLHLQGSRDCGRGKGGRRAL